MIKKNTLRITSLALAAIALGTILFLSTSESLFAQEEEFVPICKCESMEIKPNPKFIKAFISGKRNDLFVDVAIGWKTSTLCEDLSLRKVECGANYEVTVDSTWTDKNGNAVKPDKDELNLKDKDIKCEGKCNGITKNVKAKTVMDGKFTGGKYPLKGKIEITVTGTGCDKIKNWKMILFLDSKISGKNKIDVGNSDYDGDGLSNFKEMAHKTDRLNTDSDGDGISDATEVANKTDPNDKNDPKKIP
jgi:hypothetical protein